MKANRLASTLLLLLVIAAHLAAQNSEADRKLFEETKAKAEKGDAQSQLDLGVAFFFGSLGVATDHVEAVKWFRKSAEQNFAEAQFSLGLSYENGHGVVKDETEAVKWFRKSAELNHAPAQFNLGICYDNGHGRRVNLFLDRIDRCDVAEAGSGGGSPDAATARRRWPDASEDPLAPL